MNCVNLSVLLGFIALAMGVSIMGCAGGGGGGLVEDDGDGQDQTDQQGGVVINEFLASNQLDLQDQDGDYSDWIELYNSGAAAVSLAGWALTDDAEQLDKWVFPEITLGGGEYLVVFASSKDHTPADGGELHTNFGLDAAGEYLALIEADGITVADEYGPQFPQQYDDISYGLDGTEQHYFLTPSPGAVNGDGVEDVEVDAEAGAVADPEFSHEHGFYETGFSVTITAESEGATIRYTLDGSAPTESVGEVYTEPINIETTACLRAAAFAEGKEPSDVFTQTYILLDDVINQSSDPTGFPETWGWDTYTDPPEWTPADYAMDPDVVSAGPFYDDDGAFDVKDALLAVPTMSLVMDQEDLFNQSPDSATGGIYANPEGEDREWERPASIELIYPDGFEGFQVNCGVRIYGGMGRSPWAKKHSLRLFFRGVYGPTNLDFPLFGDDAAAEFDSVILRANFNDSWTMLWDAWKLERVQLVRDEWLRASQLALGSVGPHGTFVHLYINGLYWGLYNPVERPDGAFSTSYLGGDEGEWDVLHDGDPVDGDGVAWGQLLGIANAGLSTNEVYQRIQGNNPDGTPSSEHEDLLDVENLADYMLLNFYAGTEDWDIHNWYGGRRRIDSEGYRMYVWDGEISHMTLEGNDLTGTNTPGCPSQLFQALRENAEFRMLFADRVHRYFFNDGALTPEKAAARYEELTDFIDRAIVAESARWGDTVRSPAYTRDAEWSTERDWLLDEYFPQRTDIVLGFLRNAELYPSVDGPVFYVNDSHQHGGLVESGDLLSMTATTGTIWYTTDGSDPRQSTAIETGPRQDGGGDAEVLIAQGAAWQYLDEGSDPGATWLEGTVSWPSGPAELGYGDGDEQTVVNCGPSTPDCNSGNFVTTYFRHTFEVSDASQYSSLTLQLLRDDGAVVYLNGQEIVRNNIDAGVTIDSETLAQDAGDTESTWFEYSVEPSGLLVDGENIMAVEIHQTSAASSDISFNLELLSGESDSGDGDAGEGDAGTASSTAIEYTGPSALSVTTQVKARALDGGEWSSLNEATFTVIGAPELLINEFLADNAAVIEDPDDQVGAFDDWIEIYNPGDAAVDLGGLYLTDELAEPTKWQIPARVSIPVGGFLLFWADNDTEQGDTHAGFQLNADGEEIGLFGSDGLTEIDSIVFGGQTADVSYGRYPDGADAWGFMARPTPGAANEGQDGN